MARPSVISCSAFGGRSPLTGKPVGERHRWSGGAWGVGRCDFCGRCLDEVLEKPKQHLSLEQAIALGNTEGDKTSWHPHWEPGRYGATKGWYIKRQPFGWIGHEWMNDAIGKLARFDTEAQALAAIAAAAAEQKGKL